VEGNAVLVRCLRPCAKYPRTTLQHSVSLKHLSSANHRLTVPLQGIEPTGHDAQGKMSREHSTPASATPLVPGRWERPLRKPLAHADFGDLCCIP
jgi:hypothetical protein